MDKCEHVCLFEKREAVPEQWHSESGNADNFASCFIVRAKVEISKAADSRRTPESVGAGHCGRHCAEAGSSSHSHRDHL